MIQSLSGKNGNQVTIRGQLPEIAKEFVGIIVSLLEKGVFSTEEVFMLACDAVLHAEKRPMGKNRLRSMMETSEGRQAIEQFMKDITEVVNDVENE